MQIRQINPIGQILSWLGNQSYPIYLILALAIICGTWLIPNHVSLAAPEVAAEAADFRKFGHLISEAPPQPQPFPPEIGTKIRQNLSKTRGIPIAQLTIKTTELTTWPDTCLGLAKPTEMCGQMLIPGWRVVVSNGQENWIYRTDSKGRSIRLEPPKNTH